MTETPAHLEWMVEEIRPQFEHLRLSTEHRLTVDSWNDSIRIAQLEYFLGDLI